MTSDNDTDTWHCDATTLTMPRVTHKDLTRGILIFIFQKIKIFLKKFKKSKKPQTDMWHVD